MRQYKIILHITSKLSYFTFYSWTPTKEQNTLFSSKRISYYETSASIMKEYVLQ